MKMNQTIETIKTNQAWQTNCRNRQKKLVETIKVLEDKVKNILPANLPSDPKPILQLQQDPMGHGPMAHYFRRYTILV